MIIRHPRMPSPYFCINSVANYLVSLSNAAMAEVYLITGVVGLEAAMEEILMILPELQPGNSDKIVCYFFRR